MKRLYILRPEPGASATVERARAMGLDACKLPLFRIVPAGWDAPDPAKFDALLLTSANAVRHAGEGLRQLSTLPVFAVGQTTAAAADEAGFWIAGIGQAGVQSLLDTIPAGQRLLHLCGQDRVAADGSRHEVTPMSVYRAETLPVGDELGSIDGQVAAVHSPRAAKRLAELIGPRRRAGIGVAAISRAAAESAGPGWRRLEWANRPEDSALLALAARLCEEDDQG